MPCNEFSLILPDLLPRLWTFALRLSGNASEAEELVARACLCALDGSSARSRRPSPLNSMFSIIYSLWREESNRRVHRDRARPPSGHAANSEFIAAHVTSMVEQLPQALRIVLLLVNAEGLDHDEAADVLGIEASSVTRRLSRARELIGASLIAPPFPGPSSQVTNAWNRSVR
jgi:RNA polymerase sigma-70 factor (ECF subfamily)